ncbi:MAG: SPASM domain-containing protein [Bacilli bacterium]|nr:SPASM domain-containing protein [Bacilli bacterium]
MLNVSKYGIKEEDLSNMYVKIHKAARDLGFEMDDLFMFDGMCTAKMNNGMVISADGKIYKCLSGVGRKQFEVGKISQQQINTENYLFPELYEICFKENCEYIPLCNTGCRFNSYLESGNIKSISCKRDVITKINEELLKSIYLS